MPGTERCIQKALRRHGCGHIIQGCFCYNVHIELQKRCHDLTYMEITEGTHCGLSYGRMVIRSRLNKLTNDVSIDNCLSKIHDQLWCDTQAAKSYLHTKNLNMKA